MDCHTSMDGAVLLLRAASDILMNEEGLSDEAGFQLRQLAMDGG